MGKTVTHTIFGPWELIAAKLVRPALPTWGTRHASAWQAQVQQ